MLLECSVLGSKLIKIAWSSFLVVHIRSNGTFLSAKTLIKADDFGYQNQLSVNSSNIKIHLASFYVSDSDSCPVKSQLLLRTIPLKFR